MDAVNSSGSLMPALYAMKKATEVQEMNVMKVLESVAVEAQPVKSSSAADITGIGQNLDIKV